jgi:hypothetical protein
VGRELTRVRGFVLTLVVAVFCFAAAAASAGAAPDPLSDADGDGIPYQWEAQPEAVPQAAATATPRRCTAKQRLRKGRCVPKCKKGRKLKRGKCVKKKGKKKQAKRHGTEAKARASATTASVASLGANPDHKDIFVQINYASEALRQNVACGELDAIVAAFANAPVANPDGTTGINLHIDAGVSCPGRSYDLGGSSIFSAGACPGASATLQSNELPESRAGTFHLASFSPTCGGGGGEGGAAALHGVKMVVFTDGPSFAHVLMHELGHNLGLDHPFPGQPNRISTMNTRLAVSDNGNGSTAVLDFQRFSIPALDENNLSEVAGISAPAEAHRFYITHFCQEGGPSEGASRYAWPGDGSIDWNCNSPAILLPPFTPTIDPGPMALDVNGDGQRTVFPATGNEWVTLSYASGGGIGPR